MANTASIAFSIATQATQPPLFNEDLSEIIYQVFRYGLIPCISILGIAGNVASIVILTRRGFRKCSNILLLALSVSDILFLTGINNFPLFIYQETTPRGFRFSQNINYMFYILYTTFLFAHNMGLHTAMIIPVLITTERILALLSPLKALFILTPPRTVIVLASLYVLNGFVFLYYFILCRELKQYRIKGSVLGVFSHTEMYFAGVEAGVYGMIESIVNYMTGVIPISLVTMGCAVIGIQVVFITKKREQLITGQIKTTPNTPISKTTKTLLSICVLYVLCSGFGFVLTYIANTNLVENDESLKKVLSSVQDLLFCVNCVGDFVIYVGTRKSTLRTRKSNLKK
ncbi:unnamed protein product [Candidula unifasciata]|uniref:G-protein coupled receptors family 1 profile domain-containing protein n=1 Tax=Candidula unifasciata TaxID=100452 RepID=A0A8S3Z0Q4_9EUPU|nr:unnamed protein product [Candidula unifasciata]